MALLAHPRMRAASLCTLAALTGVAIEAGPTGMRRRGYCALCWAVGASMMCSIIDILKTSPYSYNRS